MNRAYSLLTVKSVDEENRTIKGIATTPSPDRMGDIVEPNGAQFKLPLPLLWQHDSRQPIGHVTRAKVTSDGIQIDATIQRIDEPGALKDRLDEAWQSIKVGLVQGLSIGFKGIEVARIEDTMGLRFMKWLWLELSAVTIPANAEATIQTVKALDHRQMAASGISQKDMMMMDMPAPAVDESQTAFMSRCADYMLNCGQDMSMAEASAHCAIRWDNRDTPDGMMQNAASSKLTKSAKSFDAKLLALPGTKQQPSVVRLDPSGVPAKLKPRKPPEEGKDMKTIAEQITALEAKRAASVAAQETEMQKSIEDDRTADGEEGEKFDDLQAEIETIDKQLGRLRKLERTKALTAKPVIEVDDAKGASDNRGGVLTVKTEPKLPPGIGFARVAKCIALAAKYNRDPAVMAEQLYGPNSIVVGVLKGTVLAGTTISGNWASFLVGADTTVFADFAEFLRPMTILGKFGNNGVPSLRQVPFRVPLLSQTAGATGYWVGESKAKPLTSITGARTTLSPLKVANICVLTEEVIRDSSPKAEVIIRDELARALQARLDTDFIDPAKTADSNVSPASITNAAVNSGSTGPDADDVFHDVKTLISEFISHDNPPANGVWIMSTTNALSLSMMMNPLGQQWFPNVSMNGGVFFGMPVIASEYVDDNVVLVNASDVYLADEGEVAVDMSRDASLEMSDAPANTSGVPTAAQLVSMFQTNSVALRAERTINWALRRTSGVAYLSTVAWGGSSSDLTV